MSSIARTATELFSSDMTRFEIRLNARLLKDLQEEFHAWAAENERVDRGKDRHLSIQARMRRRREMREIEQRRSNDGVRQAVLFLRQQIAAELSSLYRLVEYQETMRRSLATATDEAARQDTLLDHAEILGASVGDLGGDRKAFQRWFNEDAMYDRYARRRGEGQQRLAFRLERFAKILRRIAGQHGRMGISGVWRRLSINELMLDVFDFPGDPRIHVAATKCYRSCLEVLPIGSGPEFISEKSQARLYEFATANESDVWLQCEAISATMRIEPKEFATVVRERLANQTIGDDIFVRRHILRELIAISRETDVVQSLNTGICDHSVFVRQQLAEGCWELPADLAATYVRHFLTEEDHPQVVAALLAAAPKYANRVELHAEWLRLLPGILRKKSNTFVLRTALLAASRWLAAAGTVQDKEQILEVYRSSILPAINELRMTAESTPVRRWAAQSYEQIWCCLNPNARLLLLKLSELTRNIAPGTSRRVSAEITSQHQPEQIARALAVLAQDDYGYDIRYGITGCWITRQPQFGTRMWRVLHELRNPATDKRQAFSHTIGRVSFATIRVPSQKMGELSRTKVPGEPFFIASEGCWRPYLPLADDFVSILNLSTLKPAVVRFFTSQGITRVRAPRGWWQRIKAWATLTWRFEEFANLRDWDEGDNVSPATYLEAIRKLGFEIKLDRYHDDGQSRIEDTSVTKFFGLVLLPAASLWGGIQTLCERYATYFSSVYDNTLQQLIVFAFAFAIFFVARHAWSNWRLHRARSRVPLFLGGWGTRGKSGTERLKAALIGALGYSLVSKTTGCEAMFIQGNAFGNPLEIPLYRPYDKATIWEHASVIHMADKMDSSVFLWECMGLNPTYVDILQRQWSRDDLSTVTNTYPDHEDIQGPAGYNVACTIAGFVPRDAHVITTEQEMRPIVRHNCDQVKSTLRGVGWLESGLIPDEVLDRFPYREHPDNIALVAAMADELGVEYDFALKAMADELIPDLGVLKTYPLARIRSRYIEFTNGMSANERFGCLGNWTRLDYDKHDAQEEPQTWISTVINNRADRVARSRVFSDIVVNDLSADRHFLIGTNLKGLVGFIQEDLENRLSEMSLAENGAYRPATGEQKLLELAKRHRHPTSRDHVVAALKMMLHDQGIAIDSPEQFESLWNNESATRKLLEEGGVDDEIVSAIVLRQSRLLEALQDFEDLNRAVLANPNDDVAWQGLDDRYRALAKKWFEQSIVVIDDSSASGEQIIDRIVRETPPGVRNRVMGMQNIKGTGLDFVYRFQDWNTCYEACENLNHSDISKVNKAIETLQQLPVLGQLCTEHVRQAIKTARSGVHFRSVAMRSNLDTIEEKLQASESSIRSECLGTSNGDAKHGKPLAGVVDWIEEILDANDAIRRRTKADQIYIDLADERISRQRAIAELRKINKRQKGGWLAESLRQKS